MSQPCCFLPARTKHENVEKHTDVLGTLTASAKASTRAAGEEHIRYSKFIILGNIFDLKFSYRKVVSLKEPQI